MVKLGKVGFDKVGGLGGLRVTIWLPVTISSFTLTSLFTKYYNKNKNIFTFIIFILIITREQAISATSLLMATINC